MSPSVVAASPDSAPRPRTGVLRPFASLRPAVLGLFAFAGAFAVAWIAYGRTEVPEPQPGDHAWWHSSGGGNASSTHGAHAETGGVGLFLALATVALYLLLPLLTLASQALRRRSEGLRGPGSTTLPVQLVFVAVAAAACAVVTVPVTTLATALAPVAGGPLWPALTADAVAVLRLCGPVALVLTFVVGVPWAATGTGDPSPNEKSLIHAEPT